MQLEDWHDFYLLLGGAAGSLIGLLFVVATLSGNSGDLDKADRGRKLYMSPVVVQLSVVLGVGCLAMVPHVHTGAAAALTGAAGLGGLAYMLWIVGQFFSGKNPMEAHWSDKWFYSAAPAAIYALMAAAGALTAVRAGAGLVLLAISQGLLVIAGVRNAWDLITYMAPRQKKVG